MEFLCEVAKITPDYRKSLFQTFKQVMELRNRLAYAESETEYLYYDEVKHATRENLPKPK